MTFSRTMNLITEPRPSTFALCAHGATYLLHVTPAGRLAHLYWGAEIDPADDLSQRLRISGRAFSPTPAGDPPDSSLDTLPQELPVLGTSDFRAPALEIEQPGTGSRIVDLRFRSHRVVQGKPELAGLPSSRSLPGDGVETLLIELADDVSGLRAELRYSVFPKHPVVSRSLLLVNAGAGTLVIRRALSCSLDFPTERSRLHFVHLEGSWGRERMAACAPLRAGSQAIGSRRGASSHAHNPFFALTEHGMDEERGDAFGFNLVYSGNFFAQVEVDPFRCPRVQMGINPFDFSWTLEPGESFQTPEVLLGFSAEGLGGLSRGLHRFHRAHLLPPAWRSRERPVLINHWEATYFDFNEERLASIAESAAGLGVELFAVDDGWFGHRDDDRSSLGDWTAHPRKLPGGLAGLSARIHALGLGFGLWIEPEMVSPDSELYRRHPDWCLHVADRPRTEGRQQLVLDFGRAEVREEIRARVGRLLREAQVDYVKWDMNRNMTEVGSPALPPGRQREAAHRYMLGVYEVLARLTAEFPEVLFEGCSGGGGRFDPGMLHYMPQMWTSDNSDAVARLRIQYGTSLAYPLSTQAAHVSAVPNHQVGRVTPLRTRGHVALTGAFGFELDPQAMTEAERAEARAQIEAYRRHARLLIEGDLYRLRSPFVSDECAWMVVSPDKSEALVTHVTILAEANAPLRELALRGLDPDRRYALPDGSSWRGSTLMHAGLPVPAAGADFFSHQWHLMAVDPAIV
ncbi:alpha-galactosidase [Opitutaceae bacterium TAV1]|nr:alpha-galactosidase [Opitutaceae bacterium TAV1]